MQLAGYCKQVFYCLFFDSHLIFYTVIVFEGASEATEASETQSGEIDEQSSGETSGESSADGENQSEKPKLGEEVPLVFNGN